MAGKIRDLGQQEKDALQKATTSEIDVAQAKGAAETRKIVVDHYKSIFDSLKEQAGGVFDALVTKSQSVWAAIGNSFKTAILTAIKDVVTSRVAAMLMQLFTGQKVTFAGGGAGRWRVAAASWAGYLASGRSRCSAAVSVDPVAAAGRCPDR